MERRSTAKTWGGDVVVTMTIPRGMKWALKRLRLILKMRQRKLPVYRNVNPHF
jgi:hypothetical protein